MDHGTIEGHTRTNGGIAKTHAGQADLVNLGAINALGLSHQTLLAEIMENGEMAEADGRNLIVPDETENGEEEEATGRDIRRGIGTHQEIMRLREIRIMGTFGNQVSNRRRLNKRRLPNYVACGSLSGIFQSPTK